MKTAKPRVTGLCEGNSPVTDEFPPQRASNAEDVSIWWRHHASCGIYVTCHHQYNSWVVVSNKCHFWQVLPQLSCRMPVKYKCNTTDATDIFAKAEITQTEKLTNGALVTLALGMLGKVRCHLLSIQIQQTSEKKWCDIQLNLKISSKDLGNFVRSSSCSDLQLLSI